MEHWTDWIPSIIGLLIPGIFALVGLMWKESIRNWINNPYEKELDSFRNELSKELALFSSDLDQVKEQVNFKFTIYHQKKFDSLTSTYSHLMRAYLNIGGGFNNLFYDKEKIKFIHDRTISELNDANYALYGASIFIDELLFKDINSISVRFDPIIQELVSYYQDDIRINHKLINDQLKDIKKDLDVVKIKIRDEVKWEIAQIK